MNNKMSQSKEPIVIENFDKVVEDSETYKKYNEKVIAVEGNLYKVRIFSNEVDGNLSIQIVNIVTHQDFRAEYQKITNADLKEDKERNRIIELARTIRLNIIKEIIQYSEELLK